MAKRTLHTIKLDGEDEVVLRVFTPEKAEGKRPAVVMVCGLLWLGNGLLGLIGLNFNDSFGYAFARNGCPCVQIHTPSRHLAHTRLMDLLVLVLAPIWPFLGSPILRFLLVVADISMLAINLHDLAYLLPLVGLSLYRWMTVSPGTCSAVMLLAAHMLVRGVQSALNSYPGPKPRNYMKEVAAAVAWAQQNQSSLGSDGRLVLCGYSSGGHVASLYGLSEGAPEFSAVVLVSGIYSLQTDTWTGCRRCLAPIFNLMFKDILGVDSPEARENASPVAFAARSKKKQTCDWYLLTARMELMGLEPIQSILFDATGLATALEARGAKVKRATCGLNHWLLIFGFADFAGPFCKSLTK